MLTFEGQQFQGTDAIMGKLEVDVDINHTIMVKSSCDDADWIIVITSYRFTSRPSLTLWVAMIPPPPELMLVVSWWPLHVLCAAEMPTLIRGGEKLVLSQLWPWLYVSMSMPWCMNFQSPLFTFFSVLLHNWHISGLSIRMQAHFSCVVNWAIHILLNRTSYSYIQFLLSSAALKMCHVFHLFQGLPFKTVKHVTTTIDCQPTPNNGVIIFVVGQLKVGWPLWLDSYFLFTCRWQGKVKNTKHTM